jgi:hypothetical protein
MFTEEQQEEFLALDRVPRYCKDHERDMDVHMIIEKAFDAGREFERRRRRERNDNNNNRRKKSTRCL